MLAIRGNLNQFFLSVLLCPIMFGSLVAQDCLPDPGPALFYENFGSGANYGAALPAGMTSFRYGGINTNDYVVSNSTGINTNFWHDGFDHTEGDTDGYMLMFNASDGPLTFYQKDISDLCPNTDYIFSCYIANLVVPTACIGNQENPNVQLTIRNPEDSSVQVSMATGEIFYKSTLTWNRYDIHFQTAPGQTRAFIQLTNNGKGGCGNDLAIDDISLRLCNFQVEQSFDLCDLPEGSLTIAGKTYTEPGTYFNILPVPNSCNDTLVTTILTGSRRVLPTLNYSLCAEDYVEIGNRRFITDTSFVDTLAGPNEDCPLFQPVEISGKNLQLVEQNITLCNGEKISVGSNQYDRAGMYQDIFSTSSGCDSIVVTSIATGRIAVEINPVMVELRIGESIQLMSSVRFSSEYTLSWHPSDGLNCNDCLSPVLAPSESGIYKVVATDIPSGCKDSIAVKVDVSECNKVFVPNAFSPNFDGINDRFDLFTSGCFTRLVAWRIFDRWGDLVYDLNDQSLEDDIVGWDGQINGQPAAEGVYGYRLILAYNNGTQKEFRGTVMLLR